MRIEFFVPGVPKPGGSKRAFFNKKTGRAIVVDDCKRNKDWRASVTLAAYEAMNGRQLFPGPLAIEFRFYMPRPKKHYRANGQLKPDAPKYHTHKPDATKLTRSTEDALTGTLWRDDAEIAMQLIYKLYDQGQGCGCSVVVKSLPEVG
jgi:Holliday junction resolvase RusA-like endonuclease